MSQGEVERWSVSSVEETPTNQSQTLIVSPAPSIIPTGSPTVSDIIIGSTPRQEDESRVQTDPGEIKIPKCCETHLKLFSKCWIFVKYDLFYTIFQLFMPSHADFLSVGAESISNPPISSSSPLSETLCIPQTGNF